MKSSVCFDPSSMISANSRFGRRSMASENRQKTSLLRKWATRPGSSPCARRRPAKPPSVVAALAVTDSRVAVGIRRSGAVKQSRNIRRGSGATRSISFIECCAVITLVKFVCIRISCISDTISRGGFSNASAYCFNCAYACTRFFFGPLYSHAKRPFFQTSAYPEVPPSFRTDFSKVYSVPWRSTAAGVSTPSIAQRSRKCSCEADRSVRVDPRHLVMNSSGVTAIWLPRQSTRFRIAASSAPSCQGNSARGARASAAALRAQGACNARWRRLESCALAGCLTVSPKSPDKLILNFGAQDEHCGHRRCPAGLRTEWLEHIQSPAPENPVYNSHGLCWPARWRKVYPRAV